MEEEKKEKEYDVHLGYASFVYYIDQGGYKIALAGKWTLMFWRDGEGGQHRCNVNIIEELPECGFVYINTETVRRIFESDTVLYGNLLKFCIKPNRAFPLPPNKKDHHCYLDPSLWDKPKTKILTHNNREVEVRCIHPICNGQ